MLLEKILMRKKLESYQHKIDSAFEKFTELSL